MLVCDYIASNYPGGRRKNRNFFALFPRLVSDRVTHEIIERLGYAECLRYNDGTDVPDLFATFSALPKMDAASSDFRLIQSHALFQKNGDMLSPVDKENVAFESFLSTERRCSEMNAMFSTRSIDSRIIPILFHASKYISHVLGPCPRLDDLSFAFGPGASVTEVSIKQTSPQWKLAGTPTISNSLVRKCEELRALFPSWLGDQKLVPVTGRLEFVPKSFKTHRSILIEPVVNAFLQKGVGSLLKRKLAARGIDLKDQDVQRSRARKGSLDGSFATIDLSQASSSISYNLVMELLPSPWFDLLDSLRTPLARYKGKLYILEMFSSMGNGFTFELETLIFKSIIHGIAVSLGYDDDSVCYGDDITCNPSLGYAIEEYFPLFGFSVNREKSFLSGPFREACGGDYRNGIDIRPFFLKSLRDGGRWNIAKLYSFHNFLKRKPWFDYNNLSGYILDLLPDGMKIWGPDGYGDGHLLSRAELSSYLVKVDHRSKTGKRRKPWYEGFTFETFAMVPHKACGPERPREDLLVQYVSYAGLSSEMPYDPDIVRPPKGAFLESKVITVTTRIGCDSTKVDWHTIRDVVRRRKGTYNLFLSLKSL